MAEVSISVAGRSYAIAAREGEEAHIRHLESLLARHAGTALRASGGLNAERTLVYLALLLADQIDEAERNPSGAAPQQLLERIAERLEAVATALEEDAASA